jgi:hypothetical protein
MDTLPLFDLNGNPLEKRCSKCRRFFPATLEFFNKDKKHTDGLRSDCKECRKSPNQRPQYHLRNAEGLKQCSRCKEWKPPTTDYYHHNKEAKDGFLSKCKDCCKDYRKQNREHEAARSKAYSLRPEVQERRRAYERGLRNNPETRDAYQSRRNASYYKPENYARLKEYYKRPEVRARKNENTKKRYHDPVVGPRVKEQRRAHTLRYQAKKQSIPGTYTFEQIQDLLKRQKHKCYYCSAKFEKKDGRYQYHIDHTFPLSRIEGTDIPANDISYLVLACPFCNMSKSNKFPWEWPEGGRLL